MLTALFDIDLYHGDIQQMNLAYNLIIEIGGVLEDKEIYFQASIFLKLFFLYIRVIYRDSCLKTITRNNKPCGIGFYGKHTRVTA